MRPVIEHWELIVCIGGPAHGKSYTGYDYPEIKVPYFPTEWTDLLKHFNDSSPTEARIFSMTYERFLVEVKRPGLRLNGYVWKWDKLNDEDCVKAALGLVLASAILSTENVDRQDRRLTHEVGDALRLPG